MPPLTTKHVSGPAAEPLSPYLYAIRITGLGYVQNARGATRQRGCRFSIGGLDAWLITSEEQALEWADIVREQLAADTALAEYSQRVSVEELVRFTLR